MMFSNREWIKKNVLLLAFNYYLYADYSNLITALWLYVYNPTIWLYWYIRLLILPAGKGSLIMVAKYIDFYKMEKSCIFVQLLFVNLIKTKGSYWCKTVFLILLVLNQKKHCISKVCFQFSNAVMINFKGDFWY